MIEIGGRKVYNSIISLATEWQYECSGERKILRHLVQSIISVPTSTTQIENRCINECVLAGVS